MNLRSTVLRARWLLLLLPLFALASTMQVGCNGRVEGRDDFSHEDALGQPRTGGPGAPGKPSYGGYGYDNDDGSGTYDDVYGSYE